MSGVRPNPASREQAEAELREATTKRQFDRALRRYDAAVREECALIVKYYTRGRVVRRLVPPGMWSWVPGVGDLIAKTLRRMRRKDFKGLP